MMRFVENNHVALGQQEAADSRIQQQQRVVDDDHLCHFRALAHAADVAIHEKAALAPCALVAIGGDATAHIGGELEVERFKVAAELIVAVHYGEQALKLGIARKMLPADALILQAVKAE